jgi:predicted dehydrogenase
VLPVVRKLVVEGLIGRLLEIRCRGKEDARGGVLDLWVLGSHVLNLAVLFAGDPVACSAVLLKAGKPVVKADVSEGAEGVGPVAGDELHARFETESGVPVFFDSIANAGVAEANFGLQLIGTKGVIDLRIDVEPLAQVRMGNPFRPVGDAAGWVAISSGGIGVAEPIAEMKKQIGGHVAAARDLIAAMKEDRAPLCSAEDGAMTVQMIFAILESHRLEGRRVGMPLEIKENPLGRSLWGDEH